jgi:hypothetical protein
MLLGALAMVAGSGGFINDGGRYPHMLLLWKKGIPVTERPSLPDLLRVRKGP